MRIISGKYRGRKLKAVPGLKTRPTADRVREALFNILGEMVIRARVLDLYAGTGALGLEALSRGAQRAVLVEKDPVATAVIGENIAALGEHRAARLIPGDCRAALELLAGRGDVFDLILADPPYRGRAGENLLAEIGRFGILNRDGVAVIEHSPATEIIVPGESWHLLRRKKYGRTVLSFYCRAPGNFPGSPAQFESSDLVQLVRSGPGPAAGPPGKESLGL